MTCIKWAAAPHGRSEADIVLCLLMLTQKLPELGGCLLEFVKVITRQAST